MWPRSNQEKKRSRANLEKLSDKLITKLKHGPGAFIGMVLNKAFIHVL